MNTLLYTLVTDGSSDAMLIPVLTWLLNHLGVSCLIESKWAELRNIRRNRPQTLSQKILYALELYPCDLLFIHRDAELETRDKRACEIYKAIESVTNGVSPPPRICVVPVRMQEAWLLFDKEAIRRAAGNPNGRDDLSLPSIERLESLPDPKAILHNCLTTASGLPSHRREKSKPRQKVHLIPEYFNDFSPLFQLPAFASLRDDLALILALKKWNVL